MKTETAIQWLMKQITYEKDGKRMLYYVEPLDVTHLFEQAKEMEKQQHKDTYYAGIRDGYEATPLFKNSEDYFNKTFNQ